LAGYIQGPLNLNLGPTNLLPFHLTSVPNQTRLPAYERVDCRLSKAIVSPRLKATMYLEAANLLNHTNWRYYYYLIPPTVQYLGLVGRYRNSTMPFLPAAGIAFEF
jgi:hypothetical protein